MKVCYFGAYNPNYSRNAVIRAGLVKFNVEVLQCVMPPKTGTAKCAIALLRQFVRIPAHDLSALIVPEFNQRIVPLAWLLAKRLSIPVIFDPLISTYHSIVAEHKAVPRNSLEARKLHFKDKLSMLMADVLFTDTRAHADYFSREFVLDGKKIFVVPVGANESICYPVSAPLATGSFTVAFWGSFLPLHGIEYILQAAKLLQKEQEIHFLVLGKGPGYVRMRELANELNLQQVDFGGLFNLGDLPMLMSKVDICLGIFGKTEQAERVVPNKVFESMAMRKPIITGDNPAIRELFEHKRHLYTVPLGSAESIADAILDLMKNKSLRQEIADEGYHLFLEKYTTAGIGRIASDILQEVIKGLHR